MECQVNIELLSQKFHEHGLAKKAVAEKIHVSPTSIYNLFRGDNCPSYYLMVAIADLLELSNDECIAIYFPNRLKNS